MIKTKLRWGWTGMQSVERIFTSSTLAPFARLFFAMWDFPAIFCLIWWYRARLAPIPLPHLPPGNDLSFLSLIKITASALLIPVCCLKTDHLVLLFLLPALWLIVHQCSYLVWDWPLACLDRANWLSVCQEFQESIELSSLVRSIFCCTHNTHYPKYCISTFTSINLLFLNSIHNNNNSPMNAIQYFQSVGQNWRSLSNQSRNGFQFDSPLRIIH